MQRRGQTSRLVKLTMFCSEWRTRLLLKQRRLWWDTTICYFIQCPELFNHERSRCMLEYSVIYWRFVLAVTHLKAQCKVCLYCRILPRVLYSSRVVRNNQTRNLCLLHLLAIPSLSTCCTCLGSKVFRFCNDVLNRNLCTSQVKLMAGPH